MDHITQNLLLYTLVPLTIVLCLAANLLLRVKGTRSMSLRLKALGVEVKFSTHTPGSVSDRDDIEQQG